MHIFQEKDGRLGDIKPFHKNETIVRISPGIAHLYDLVYNGTIWRKNQFYYKTILLTTKLKICG